MTLSFAHSGRFHKRYVGHAVRLLAVGVLALAVLLVPGLGLRSNPQMGFAMEQTSGVQVRHVETDMAVAVGGMTYLAAATPAQTNGGIGDPNSAPMRLNNALDPLQTTGAFYPLRQAIEQLSLWFILPFIALSLLHAVSQGAGNGDVQFARLAQRLVVATLLLYLYPAWDVLCFRFIAIPIAQAVDGATASSGALRNAIAGKLNLPGGNTQSSSASLDQMTQTSLACSAGSGVCPQSQGAMQVVDSAMKAGNTSSTDDNGMTGTSTSGGWLASTVTGWTLTLFHLAMSVLLWFIWLGVVVARCVSLTFAPMAMIWSLAPGGDGKATKWFKGHAKICFTAVGFSFAGLICWVLFAATLSPAMLGVGIVAGVALKGALFCTMFAVLIKSQKIMSLIGGDVAEVASEIGTGFRDRGIQMVTTMGKAGFAAGSYMQHGGANAMLDRAGNMRQLIKSGNYRGAGRAMLQNAREGARGSWQATKWVAKNRVQANQVNNMGAMNWANLASMTTGAYSSVQQQMRANRVAAPVAQKNAQGATAAGEAVKSRAEKIAQLETEYGIKIDTHRRPGEQIQVDVSGIEAGKGWGWKARGDIGNLGQALFEAIAAHDAEFGVMIDPKTGIAKLDEGTLNTLYKEMDQNPALKRSVEKVLQESWGDKVPTIAGANGALPDLARGVEKSTMLSEAIAYAAQVGNRYNDELYRRELVSAYSGAEHGSAVELALRNMDPRLLSWVRAPEAGETLNKRAMADSLQGHAAGLARRAWYRSASPEDRARAGLSIVDGSAAGEREAAATKGLDSRVGELRLDMLMSDGSAAKMGPGFQAALADVAREQHAHFDALDGRKGVGGLGFDREAFVESGGDVERYNAQEASPFAQLRDYVKGEMDEGEVYESVQRLVENAWAEGRMSPPAVRAANESEEDFGERMRVELNNRIFADTSMNLESEFRKILDRGGEGTVTREREKETL